jgi:hypothetical protein
MGEAFVEDRRDWLRLAGGLLFAAGAIVLLARKGGVWSNLAILVTLLVPMVVLLGLGLRAPAEPALAWRSVYLILGILLVAAVLLQFVNWIGGTPGTDLNLFWIFGVTAVVALYLAVRRALPYGVFLAAVAGLVSWISVWDKIAGNPSADTVRWIFFAIGALYVLVAVVRRADAWHADVLTAAGVAFAVTGAVTLVVVLGASIARSLVGSITGGELSKPSEWWSISLLIESVGLIAYAARTGRRGAGYVGAVLLAELVAIVGVNIDALFAGKRPSTIDGWPLGLLIGGAVLVVASFVLRPGARDEIRIVRAPDQPPDT